jgi:beta-N-acetylhexosaminidase
MRIICTLIIVFGATLAMSQSTLSDFYSTDVSITTKADSIYDSMSDADRVGQIIMPAVGKHGKPTDYVIGLIKKRQLGGILLLNGDREGFKQMVSRFDSLGKSAGCLPFLYSADAEPSLIKYKIKNCSPVPNANKLTSSVEVKNTAASISKDLNYIGINYNFAPVVDQGTTNSAITNRSFGFNTDSISVWSNAFINVSQSMGVITTAKHFPGHGLVVGDTHEKLVFIDGIMKEVENYKPIIAGGVVSIMVAHIAVKNNPKYGTNGMPATCSKKIVTDLLKTELNFKGLIVTDAMNMGGVRSIPQCGLKAVEAGCDILLMPVNEPQDIADILKKYQADATFKLRVEDAVKKIIRSKVCLGLI